MQYVAFLRAINVGGRRIKMDVLRNVFEQFGFSDVATIIASGNVVFDSPTHPNTEEIGVHFEREVGFTSMVFIRSADRVREIVDNRPWQHDGAVVDVSFLASPPDPLRSYELETAAVPPEAIAVIGSEVFFLRSGKGLAMRHKEADAVRILARESTRRSLTTVERIARTLRT